MGTTFSVEVSLELAAALRDACADTAQAAYEQASMSGLCSEGAWEVALGAVRSFDVAAWLASRRQEAEAAAAGRKVR